MIHWQHSDHLTLNMSICSGYQNISKFHVEHPSQDHRHSNNQTPPSYDKYFKRTQDQVLHNCRSYTPVGKWVLGDECLTAEVAWWLVYLHVLVMLNVNSQDHISNSDLYGDLPQYQIKSLPGDSGLQANVRGAPCVPPCFMGANPWQAMPRKTLIDIWGHPQERFRGSQHCWSYCLHDISCLGFEACSSADAALIVVLQ